MQHPLYGYGLLLLIVASYPMQFSVLFYIVDYINYFLN
jgi:hypothetical protein